MLMLFINEVLNFVVCWLKITLALTSFSLEFAHGQFSCLTNQYRDKNTPSTQFKNWNPITIRNLTRSVCFLFVFDCFILVFFIFLAFSFSISFYLDYGL